MQQYPNATMPGFAGIYRTFQNDLKHNKISQHFFQLLALETNSDSIMLERLSHPEKNVS